jgi:hypothetical protein
LSLGSCAKSSRIHPATPNRCAAHHGYNDPAECGTNRERQEETCWSWALRPSGVVRGEQRLGAPVVMTLARGRSRRDDHRAHRRDAGTDAAEIRTATGVDVTTVAGDITEPGRAALGPVPNPTSSSTTRAGRPRLATGASKNGEGGQWQHADADHVDQATVDGTRPQVRPDRRITSSSVKSPIPILA